MKKLSLLFSLCFFAALTFAQKALPSAEVKTLEGQAIDIKSLVKEGQITVISFWATWCKPCVQELETIKELYPDWKEKYGVEFIAVSVDDSKTIARVKPYVSNKGWAYTIVTDATKAFQTAMNVNNPPLTVIVNQKGEIVFEHLGYAQGDELELEEKIIELAKK
jgi:cytochrome c biogenesis protein CcmG, thiol:disulfide interchange protein DsbE